MYRGACGVHALNPASARKAERRVGNRVFRVGDRVMQTRNDYDRDVFNGDVGRVIAIDPAWREIAVEMDGHAAPVTYTWDEVDELTHAYAVSIHKSQGSEYPAVVVPVLTQHHAMLDGCF
jgi:exodeoxyribonuclease V alpha subunit